MCINKKWKEEEEEANIFTITKHISGVWHCSKEIKLRLCAKLLQQMSLSCLFETPAKDLFFLHCLRYVYKAHNNRHCTDILILSSFVLFCLFSISVITYVHTFAINFSNHQCQDNNKWKFEYTRTEFRWQYLCTNIKIGFLCAAAHLFELAKKRKKNYMMGITPSTK